MMNKLATLSIPVFISLTPTAAISQDLQKCSEIQNPELRLTCFDALVTPKTIAVNSTNTHSWRSNISTDPMSDKTIAVISTTGETTNHPLSKSANLYIRCQDDQTDLFIDWKAYLARDDSVRLRLDNQKPKLTSWLMSSDSTATFHRQPIDFIKFISTGSKLVTQATPFQKSDITAVFDITGINEAIKPIKQHCNW